MKLTAYAPQPWPKGRYKRYRARKSCARNAYMLALDHPDELRLVKGYAFSSTGSAWIGHWWCVDSEDRVVDPSWKNDGLAYVGIETVDVAAYSKLMLETGYYEVGVETFADDALVPALERALASR